MSGSSGTERGLFRPFRAGMFVCAGPGSQGVAGNTQGVALGWFVAAPSGRDTKQRVHQDAPGCLCVLGPVPRALPWASLWLPLRGGTRNSATSEMRQDVCVCWARFPGRRRQHPGRCPGLVCGCPFGAGLKTAQHQNAPARVPAGEIHRVAPYPRGPPS